MAKKGKAPPRIRAHLTDLARAYALLREMREWRRMLAEIPPDSHATVNDVDAIESIRLEAGRLRDVAEATLEEIGEAT